MELNLQKAFYMIIAIVLLGLLATKVASPVYNKISSQTERINTVDFTTDGSIVSP